MKFEEYKYLRPNIEKISEELKELTEKFINANNVEEQINIIDEVNNIKRNFNTMHSLATIRFSIDTKDEFYDKENIFFNENMPIYQNSINDYSNKLVESKYRNELENKYGKIMFELIDMDLKTFNPNIIVDLQEENRLNSEYSKLLASAEINFRGEVLNLSQIMTYAQDKCRKTRKEAYEKYSDFFETNEEKFDNIYDELVKVRHIIAKKLGFENFVEVGYLRMNRGDYGPKEVANYRKQVLDTVVPIATKIKEKQAKRLGFESLKYYDEQYKFRTGNAKPKGDKKWMVEKAKIMYEEISPETNDFFSFMIDRELLDLDTKPGKRSGGYCTYIPNYKSPFIFANFNGTSSDVDVLTHEAGHAFQMYSSRHIETPELAFPTFEACEIHSMGMEFITWPWMNLFFEEDELKYRYSHLTNTMLFMPFSVTVDEFQHYVYENPSATPEQRKNKWREIEKKYIPTKDYEDNDFYNRGGYWFKQMHIFQVPFYYIDYTLAQICALQIWNKMKIDKLGMWKDYVNLCKEGGSKSFLELLEVAKLENPFNSGTIEKIIGPVEEWIDSIDDSKF